MRERRCRTSTCRPHSLGLLVTYSLRDAKAFGINIAGFWGMVVRLLLPFLLLAAAPCWIMRRVGHWALDNASRIDSAVIWFGHLRAITVISTILWLAWLGLVVLLDPWRNLANALLIHDPFIRALLYNGLAVLPPACVLIICDGIAHPDRKSTRLNSSHSQSSYAVFSLKKKKTNT